MALTENPERYFTSNAARKHSIMEQAPNAGADLGQNCNIDTPNVARQDA